MMVARATCNFIIQVVWVFGKLFWRKRFIRLGFFENWQGVQAKFTGIAVRHFKASDFGIPYSYSPVLVTSEVCMKEKSQALRAFLAATAKGYA